MYQLLRKDVAFKGLAVLLAILLWLYVVNSKKPADGKNLDGSGGRPKLAGPAGPQKSAW
jgi:YbbR domain-containing protein